jgi:Zn-dependent peptidase ImmA (M78 family)
MEPGKEGLALFTGFHEGGHLVMHWDVFVNKDGYPYERTIDEAAVLCCRRENIESFGFGKKERTASEWREHQADYFAAAIAMPNATFRPFVNGIMRENNYYKGYIKTGIDDELDILANDLLPEYISETYGVSKRAARIKLRKAGFVGNTVKSK